MANRTRLLTAAAVLGAGAALAACGQPDFVDVPPPAPTYTEQPTYQKPLPPEDFTPGKPGITQSPLPPPEPSYDPRGVNPPLGGPPPPRYRDPGGPPPPPEPFKMAPIPNPEDLTPEDRAKIYGPGERAERELAGAPTKPRAGKPGASKPAGKKHSTGARPNARPAAPSAARPARPAPQTAAPAKPTPPKAAAPAPYASKPAAPKPDAPAPASPKAAPAPAAPAPAAKTEAVPAPKAGAPAPAAAKTKPEQLGEALAGDVTSGAQFDTKALADGNEGIVTLNLPPSLFARLREEAGKLGLGPQARNAEAQAKLSGEGYEITPNDTQTARLKEGEATNFTWNVKPLDNASGTLGADVGVQLKGIGKAVDAHLASLEAKTKPDEDKGPGKVPLSPTMIGWGLAGLVAIIVFFAALSARNNRRKEERARRARAAASFGDYGGAEADKTTTTTTRTEKPKS